MALIGPVSQAWAHLMFAKRKRLADVIGLCLSLVLVLTLAGAYHAVLDFPIAWLQRLDADLLLTAGDNAPFSDEFNKLSCEALQEAKQCEGVASVVRLDVASNLSPWRGPGMGRVRGVRVLSVRPSDSVFVGAEWLLQADKLRTPGTVLLDRCSREPLGEVGEGGELAGQSVNIVGEVEVGGDFLVPGSIILSETTQGILFGENTLKTATLGLVRLSPETSLQAVRDRLLQKLPSGVAVLDKETFLHRERDYWRWHLFLAPLLGLATLLATLLSSVFCWWVLFRIQWPHLVEFFMLSLLGYGPGYLTSVLVMEAFFLLLLAGTPALLSAHALLGFQETWTGLPQSFRLVQLFPYLGWAALLMGLLAGVNAILLLRRIQHPLNPIWPPMGFLR